LVNYYIFNIHFSFSANEIQQQILKQISKNRPFPIIENFAEIFLRFATLFHVYLQEVLSICLFFLQSIVCFILIN